MDDTEIKRSVSEFLKSNGFTVESLPQRKDTKTPDLRATQNTETILIEIKTKGDDPKELSEIRARLERGGAVVRSKSGGPRNRLAGIIKAGVDQLSECLDDNALRVLWIYVMGEYIDLQVEQIRNTLYGSTRVLSSSKSSEGIESKMCFYFHPSSFYRFQDVLDAAVITYANKALLCANTYSPRKESLRKSHFTQIFEQAVIDPEILESEGKAYIADCDLDRKNKTMVLDYLKQKYSKDNLSEIEMHHLSGSILVPNTEFGG